MRGPGGNWKCVSIKRNQFIWCWVSVRFCLSFDTVNKRALRYLQRMFTKGFIVAITLVHMWLGTSCSLERMLPEDTLIGPLVEQVMRSLLLRYFRSARLLLLGCYSELGEPSDECTRRRSTWAWFAFLSLLCNTCRVLPSSNSPTDIHTRTGGWRIHGLDSTDGRR